MRATLASLVIRATLALVIRATLSIPERPAVASIPMDLVATESAVRASPRCTLLAQMSRNERSEGAVCLSSLQSVENPYAYLAGTVLVLLLTQWHILAGPKITKARSAHDVCY